MSPTSYPLPFFSSLMRMGFGRISNGFSSRARSRG